MDVVKAARALVSLDQDRRGAQGPSTRERNTRARYAGAVSLWEALTGKGIEYAYEVIEDDANVVEPGVWRHADGTPCPNYPDSFNFTYTQSSWTCVHGDLICHKR
jgi:hypothetical protein